ncbi:MAG: hypothetical protein ACMXYE_05325 [Candidatus Woesearchaeota archaeon]
MDQKSVLRFNFICSLFLCAMSAGMLFFSLKELIPNAPNLVSIVTLNLPVNALALVTLFMVFAQYIVLKKGIYSELFRYQYRINIGIIAGILLALVLIVTDVSSEKYSILMVIMYILPVLIIAYIASLFLFFIGYRSNKHS